MVKRHFLLRVLNGWLRSKILLGALLSHLWVLRIHCVEIGC